MVAVERYELVLEFDFQELTYLGREKIIGDFRDNIEMDSHVREIKRVEVDGKIASYKHENGKLSIEGKGREILIEFENKVSEVSLMGIYKSSTPDGYIITTQMEPTGARYFIPCFDEPAKKAVFKVQVTVNDPNLDIIFNTDVEHEEVVDQKKTVIFKETPKMSTYLIYLGIGKFEYLSKEHNGKKLRVITERGKSKFGKFALDILSELIDAYEQYYEIPYPLSKLDLISISQFAAGAMENWGAITFRESLLLKTETTSFNLEKTIAKVISHELAHQWFGDLVTMKWWEDLWLNESFATFMGDKMVKKIRPDWKVDEEFIVESLYPSMELDSLTTTHPISVKVNNPDEIAEIFDSISYGKGGSILRMIENYMGEEEFRKGIVNYLNKFSYSNASASDLWNSLQQVSGKNIGEIMSKWISKEGHPYVRIERIKDGQLLIQGRFSYLNKNDDYVWPIPMKVSLNNDNMEFLMDKERVITFLDFDKIDPDVKGYYRVLYDEAKLHDIFKKTRHSYEEGIWISKVLDDYYAFALGGKVQLKSFFDILRQASQIKNYVIILRVLDIYGDLMEVIGEDKNLKDSALKFLNTVNEYIKSEKDKNILVLKEKVSARLAQLDHAFRLSLLSSDISRIPAEERLAYFISLVKEGRGSEVIKVIEEHKDEPDTVRGIQAITQLDDPNELFKVLERLKKRLDLRANLIYMVMGSTRNPKFRERIWDWIDENYNLLREFYAGSGYLSFMVESLFSYSSIGYRDRLEKFLGKINISEVKRGADNGLEWLRIHENLISEYQKMHN